MATPKAIPAVSTPINTLASTPNRPNASPRPNAGAFANKTLAYKSPAVKTPASLHGHAHNVSISSQPNSTPMAPPAIHDELLNLNSPAAALIASIGNTGLTPIAIGSEGLGITSAIPPPSIRDGPSSLRNPEMDRLSRLNQVTKLLKTRSAGRGITRDGVERIARIHGFTIFWDEDNLTIAGNSVDLEIIFHHDASHVIRDVQLKLNTSSSEEPVMQHKASDVLKRHLTPAAQSELTIEVWTSLDRFAQDLDYLSQLDHSQGSTNCFELTSDLYTVFQNIWDEEKKRMRDRPEAYRICHGNIGKPLMDEGHHLGIASQFWVDGRARKIAFGQGDDVPAISTAAWTARFSCEKGSPGINARHEWVENEPLKTAVTTEDVFEESQVEKPNWSSASITKSVEEQQKDADAMLLDGPPNPLSDSLGIRFTCQLNTVVWIPISMASELNTQYPMFEMDQSQAMTYQNALLHMPNPAVDQQWHSGTRWLRSVTVFDKHRQSRIKEHSYALFASGIPWSYPVSVLRFCHPKQFADALPILRQYALLWTILHSSLDADKKTSSLIKKTVENSSSPKHSMKSTAKRRSNRKAVQDGLEALLGLESDSESVLRIDLSLDVVTDPSNAKVEVIIPMHSEKVGQIKNRFIQVTINIGRNGVISIPVLRGVKCPDEDKLKQRAVKVLDLSEDLSVLIEWLLDLNQTSN